MLRKDFQIGQVWWMDEPIRVVRVTGFDTVTVPNKEHPDQPVEKPCVIVEGTIPACEIPGFLPAADVPDMEKIKRGSGDTVWTEIYAERFVPLVRKDTKSPALVYDESRPQLQVYCFAEENRSERATRTSPIANRPIKGRLIPPEDVPPGLFGKPVVVKEPEPEASSVPEPQAPSQPMVRKRVVVVHNEADPPYTSMDEVFVAQAPLPDPPDRQIVGALPHNYMKLVKIASDRGVDISDIHGSGSIERIIERLQAQEAGP